MLTSLHIKNYVLIDSLDIEFPEGLIIITGQTGAGKSIILGALSLLLGAKADASMLGNGEGGCVVEGVFDLDDDGEVRKIIEDGGADWGNGHLIIRRVVNVSGRSRSFINDCPVRVDILSAISARLIDIHSQHQTLLLTDNAFQMSLLDHFAGNDVLLEECHKAYSSLRCLEASYEDVSERIRKLLREKDYNESLYNELNDADLKDGELEELETEQKQLAHAESIKSALYEIEDLMNPEDVSDGMRESISSVLKEVERLFDKVSAYIPEAETLINRISSARIELEDILSVVSDINAGVELSPERLRLVDERMSFIYGLFHKYSCTEVGELINEKEKLSGLLYDSVSLENEKNKLADKIKIAKEHLTEIANKLSASRRAAAIPFSKDVQESIRFLELSRAVFIVDVVSAKMSASGQDSVRFLFSANGTKPTDVAECASGGEMSRIMLCLKAMLARYSKMPTMVFDEIDTGVSGSAADKMGSMICKMGENMQVFAITHQPQVAAKGLAHYLVSKDFEPKTNTAVTNINKLGSEERVMEVARMLSGSNITEAAIANARDLISN